jgi:hypothetical protein
MPRKKSFLVMALLSLVTAVRLSGECSSTVAVLAPTNACKSGTATVGVAGVPGAAYAWTVDGGTIAGDAAGDRVNLTFGSNSTATVSVTMTAGGCVSHGSSVIALHDPFNVRVAAVPAAHAGEPLTFSWTYSDGSPARQTITGSDFGTITLAPAVRTYTYSPDKSGTKQIVIDAALATAASTPLPSRQRAVAKSPASASSCTQLHTAVPYTVGECIAPSVVIDAPDAVVKEKSFHVTVRSQAGAVAFWTITNGSPATATGEDVTITAGSSGNVGVSVQLTRGICGQQAERSIPILAEAVCDHPTAVVSAGPISCGSAIVNVSFTGTAPFKGTWSDGVPFTATQKSFTRTVTQPFSYSITNFDDVMCAGTSSGVAVIPEPHPTATITTTGNGCVGVDTITATFTGTPPFTGYWHDANGTTFQTNSMQISRPIFVNCITGFPALLDGHDGTGCPITLVGAMPIAHVPEQVTVGAVCNTGNTSQIYANFYSSSCLHNISLEGPWTAVWSDGVTTASSNSNSPNSTRIVSLGPTPTTYTVVRAYDKFCDAQITKPSVTPYRDPIADFVLPNGVCQGQTQTVSLLTPPPQGATVTWSTDNGSIVSGQGTSTMQYTPSFVGSATIGCTFSFPDPDRCPVVGRRACFVGPVDPPASLTLASTQIHAGQTVDITVNRDFGVLGWSWSNSLNDSITPVGACTGDFVGPGVCHARYTSSHSTGVSTITMHAYGYCATKDYPLQLTIVP